MFEPNAALDAAVRSLIEAGHYKRPYPISALWFRVEPVQHGDPLVSADDAPSTGVMRASATLEVNTEVEVLYATSISSNLLFYRTVTGVWCDLRGVQLPFEFEAQLLKRLVEQESGGLKSLPDAFKISPDALTILRPDESEFHAAYDALMARTPDEYSLLAIGGLYDFTRYAYNDSLERVVLALRETNAWMREQGFHRTSHLNHAPDSTLN